MRQLDLFSTLQPSTEGIDTEFKSARSGCRFGVTEVIRVFSILLQM